MIWSTSKTFIKNIIEDCWDKDELRTIATGDKAVIKTYIDELNPELWQNAYTEVVYLNWKDADYKKIGEAATKQLLVISDED